MHLHYYYEEIAELLDNKKDENKAKKAMIELENVAKTALFLTTSIDKKLNTLNFHCQHKKYLAGLTESFKQTQKIIKLIASLTNEKGKNE